MPLIVIVRVTTTVAQLISVGAADAGLDIAAVITDRFPAAQWDDAFQPARSGRGGKVVMDWTQLD